MSELKIKKGAKHDVELFTRLTIESSPLLPDTFGKGIIAALPVMFVEGKNLYGMDYVSVAHWEGEAAGMLLAYNHRAKDSLLFNTGLIMLREIGVDLLAKLPLLLEFAGRIGNVKNDEFYISNLGVDARFRGKGVGAALLKHAEQLAGEAGLRAVALEADSDNTPAIALYTKYGYSAESEITLKALGGKKFLRMTKEL